MISVDAGPLHIAAAVGVPVMAIVGNDKNGIGSSPIRLWMPRSKNLTRTESEYIATNVVIINLKMMVYCRETILHGSCEKQSDYRLARINNR